MGRKGRNIYLKTKIRMFFTLDTDISKLKFEIWPMFFLLSVFSTPEGTF